MIFIKTEKSFTGTVESPKNSWFHQLTCRLTSWLKVISFLPVYFVHRHLSFVELFFLLSFVLSSCISVEIFLPPAKQKTTTKKQQKLIIKDRSITIFPRKDTVIFLNFFISTFHKHFICWKLNSRRVNLLSHKVTWPRG